MDCNGKKRNILKKVVCIALIIMMLAGNFITPAKIIAEEIKEEKSQNEMFISEENTGSNSESIDVGSTNAENNEGKSESTTKENTDKTDEMAPNNADSLNESSDTNNAQMNNEEQKEEHSKDGNSSDNLSVKANSESTKSKAPQKSNVKLAENAENSLEALKQRLTPLTNKDFVTKLNNDDHEIRMFNMQFLYGAKLDEAGNLVWTPSNTTEGHQFSFRINYAISGLKELPPESIKITIPKSIIRNRDKDFDDRFIMSLPTSEEWDGTTEFAYIENEDYLVIYNPAEIPAGLNGYIEVAYETKSKTFSYRDYDKTNTGLVKDDGTGSDPFYATIAVTSGEDTLTNITDEKNIFIDTTARIVSTQKRYPNIYREWNSSWMNQTPADADDYYYLVWELKTNIDAPTQPYNFKIDDFVTDLTEGITGEDYELVGYKLAGERYYSNKNSATNQTLQGIRYDYVLTRHKKSTYSGIKYTLKNSETATVDPIDQVDEDTSAKSQNIFYWDPSFEPPTGHFELYKDGNNTGFNGRYSNYELQKLQNKEVDELNNFRYRTETEGYAYPWTLIDEGSLDNPEDYGHNNVNYETWEDTLNLEEDSRPVNYEDYYLNDLSYTISNKDAEFDDFLQKFNTISPVYQDDEAIIFYGKFNGGDDWVQIGTYNLKTKKLTPNAEYVEEMTTSKITFKPGVHATGWRFTTSNKHYYTDIVVIPHYVLTNSEYVGEKIKGKDVIRLQNKVNTKITDHNNESIFEREKMAIDYARVTYFDSEISKEVSSVSNNVVKKSYNITWKVNVWETATNGMGKAEYIEQESGKFYDLIPFGGVLDTSSIQVKTNLGFLENNEFSYEIIPNYSNSGREMLVITMDKKADWYTAYYTTVHSWDSIKDFGKNVLNPVGYETGNEKITHGHPDNGGNLSEGNKALYNNLDSETDANKFLYTESTYDINALTATTSGLYKKVKNSKEEEYSYDTQVEAGGKYSYKYRYQNTFVNKAKNLIFFDSLENFKIVNTEEGTTKTSGWKGTIQTIDLTQLRKKGIAPVVYISTEEDLDLEVYNDLTDTTIWKEATETTDLSTAKAIAIDMRKDTNGNNFELDAGDSVTVTVHMKAPNNIIDEHNPYTYNNIYIKNTLIDELEGNQDFYIHQDYTRVKYHVIADVPFYKVSSEDENYGIKGITFRLYGTSRYGTEIDEYVKSNRNGLVNFKDIEAGEYILQEYEATPDWLEDHTEHRVKITTNREVYIAENPATNDILEQVMTDSTPIKIKNTPRIHTDVIFYKKDLADKNKALEGVKFKLEGTSDYGNEVLMYVTSETDGKVTFKNVEKGTYTLIEVETIDGYILDGKTYKVIVDENGNLDIQKPVLKTKQKTETITEYSHTPNINDEGIAEDNYANNLAITDTVTIEGAESLDIIVYYSTESTSYDWVCVYDNSVTPSASNHGNSISGKLGDGRKNAADVNSSGYQNALVPKTCTITGDTAQFFFESDSSVQYYGYYAIITATIQKEEIVEGYESTYDNGNYYIYNEPYHSFFFTKKDAYNYEKLGGAKFKLYGCSNTGNTYNQIATSVEGTGYVTFENLESGTYVLREIEAPNIDDVTYVQDKTSHIVEVFEDGKVTLDGNAIWPLSEANNEPYTWYNTRNKGQITVTKKWVDNKTNEEREEPVIYISTKKPEQSYQKAYFRTASDSRSIIDYVTTDSGVTSFRRNTTLSEAQVQAKAGVTRLDNDYNNTNTEYKIYGWVEDGTLYWWTKADSAVLPANLDYYFNNESSLKEISWTGIYKNGYWKGTIGSEELTESITNMRNMFYNCSSIENLNISWFNNSQITAAGNMEYAFGNNYSSTAAGKMSTLKYITIGENFKLFNTSALTKGSWKNQKTGALYANTSLIDTLTSGTYEYVGIVVKYAVQIYGINQDEDASGGTLGLTFGPATGADYNNSYVTHEYEETSEGSGEYYVKIVTHTVAENGSETTSEAYLTDSSSNNVTRTTAQVTARENINLHEMTWAQISAVSDKTLFEDCMLCGDTKSVQINLNSTLASGTTQTAYGDGAGMLCNTIDRYYGKWNPSSEDNSAAINGGVFGSNAIKAGGYSSSHVRATLVGANEKTDITYAGDVNATSSTSLYSCIQSDLQNVITAKKVKYVTGRSGSYNSNIVYDKIWLFSEREVYGTGIPSDNTTAEGIGTSGVGYDKFGKSSSKYYMSLYNNSSTANRKCFDENNLESNWWLRSPYLSDPDRTRNVDYRGNVTLYFNFGDSGLAFGFCIK